MQFGASFLRFLVVVCVWSQAAATANADEDVDPGFQVETPSSSEDFFPVKDNILLASWEPHPVDQWDYAVLNVTEQYVSESGRIPITDFTKNFPDVSLVLTCNRGDNAYFPNQFQAPIIGVDSFQNDFYFQQYLSLIYTIHGFSNPTQLWAHFLMYPDAFLPVHQRVYSAFQEYVENYHADPQPQYNDNEVARTYLEDRRRL